MSWNLEESPPSNAYQYLTARSCVAQRSKCSKFVLFSKNVSKYFPSIHDVFSFVSWVPVILFTIIQDLLLRQIESVSLSNALPEPTQECKSTWLTISLNLPLKSNFYIFFFFRITISFWQHDVLLDAAIFGWISMNICKWKRHDWCAAGFGLFPPTFILARNAQINVVSGRKKWRVCSQVS